MSFDVATIRTNHTTSQGAAEDLERLETGIRSLEEQLTLTQGFYDQASQPRSWRQRMFGSAPPMSLADATTKLADIKSQLTTARDLETKLAAQKTNLEETEAEAQAKAEAEAAKKKALEEAKDAERGMIRGESLERIFGDKLDAVSPDDRASLDAKYKYLQERLEATRGSTFGKQFFAGYAVEALESMISELKRVGLLPAEFDLYAE